MKAEADVGSLNKRLAFIVSGGRTGTRFFAEKLNAAIEGAYAVHEPDVLSLNVLRTLQQIRDFGFRHMITDRLRRKSGIRQLTEASICDEISEADLIEQIRRARISYYSSIPYDIIIESYYAWYGLVPYLESAFGNVRVLSVIRDPRDWVRSNMNWGTQFGYRDWVTRLGFGRINPSRAGDGEFSVPWNEMDQFSRLCWFWRTIYGCLVNAGQLPFVRTVRYEDIFLGPDRERHFAQALLFLLEGAHETPSVTGDFLTERVHENVSYSFPHWSQWNRDQATRLQLVCGTLMEDFGYGQESAWRQLLDR